VHAEKPEVDFFAPKSGALGWIDTFAIPAKSKNVEGAYKWINFIMRPENAAEFTNSDTTANCSKGSNQFVKASIRSNFERSFTSANIEKSRILNGILRFRRRSKESKARFWIRLKLPSKTSKFLEQL
jgi:spermidine/putrescine-binding protein